MLNAIGYFLADLADEELPAPQELVGVSTMSSEIADYLDKGLKYIQWRGHSWCRFCCGVNDCEMGSKDLTDGRWVWPEGLSHYIRSHEVALPPEFCEHVMSGQSMFLPEKNLEYDYKTWVDWTRSYRDLNFRSCLERARYDNIQESNLEIEQVIDELISKHGECEHLCFFSGCDKRSLSGMQFCASHHPILQNGWHIRRNSYQKLVEIFEQYQMPNKP